MILKHYWNVLNDYLIQNMFQILRGVCYKFFQSNLKLFKNKL